MQDLKAAYDRGEIPFEKLFENYSLPSKYPEVTAATGSAFTDAAATDKGVGVLDFNALKKQFGDASAEMNNRYADFQQSNDIGDYAARQRALDEQARGLTENYATTARGQMGDAANVVNRYRTEGQSALDRYLGNAQDFYNKDIPAAIQQAQDRATAYTSRYGLGRGGGLGSDILNIASTSAVNAALPYRLQGRQYVGEALGRYAPFYGDVAARDYGRITGFNAPMEANIYNARTGDVMRSKATEQQLQSLDMMVKERGLNAAIQNLRNQGMAQGMINDLVRQWQGLKSGTLSLAGQAAGMEQAYGGERGYNYIPGSGPITQPEYYGLPMPNFPTNYPSRYSPSVPSSPPALNAGGTPPAATSPQRLNAYGLPMTPAEIYTAQHGIPSQYGGKYPGGLPYRNPLSYNDVPNPDLNYAWS